MVSQLQSAPKPEIIYPDSDGKPMSDNTKQFRWIVVIQQNLEWLFADDPNVFVAGDLLWYPVEGNPKLYQFRLRRNDIVKGCKKCKEGKLCLNVLN